MPPGPSWRAAALARLDRETFDVLVIGGGATGAAVARDAALRGLRVALCERGDFAGQTSGQSSKLIHGGLRYLRYGNLSLVFEGLRERRRLLRTARHLCRPIEFLFPVHRAERPSLALLALGVGLYDALALWRDPVAHRRLSAGAVFELQPMLRSAGLRGAELYVDCQTDDARLVLENVLDAVAAGAVAASYLEIAPDQSAGAGSFRTACARDRQSGDAFRVRARCLVNAAGPFADALHPGPRVLRPTLGVHLVFDAERLPTGGRAVVIRSPRDDRLVFTLPAGARTIVGTTDTDWTPPDGDRPPRPEDEIRASGADVEYLLEAANAGFPPAALVPDDVLSTFAGLRPLIARGAETPSATSREHEIWIDRRGILTVAGGKLTTMRKMAEETVDRLVEVLCDRGFDGRLAPCTTRDRPLPGAGATAELAAAIGLAPDVAARLREAYGSRAVRVAALAAENQRLRQRIDDGLPYLWAEVVFAARHDLACEVEDVLRRRVPVFRDAYDQGLGAAAETADVLTREFGWSAARRNQSLEAYRATVASSRKWRSELPSWLDTLARKSRVRSRLHSLDSGR